MTAYKSTRSFRAVTPGPAPQRSGDGTLAAFSPVPAATQLDTDVWLKLQSKEY